MFFFFLILGWDHDIDTLPFFAWTKSMFKRLPSKVLGKFQRFYWYIGPFFSFFYIEFLGITFFQKKRDYWQFFGNVLSFVLYGAMLNMNVYPMVLVHFCTSYFSVVFTYLHQMKRGLSYDLKSTQNEYHS